MTHDMKLGLAFAILSVGLVTAFWMKDAGISSEALPQLLSPEAVATADPPAPYPHAVADTSSIADEPWALPAYPDGSTAPAASPAPVELARPAEPAAIPLEALPQLPPAFGFDMTPVAPVEPLPRHVADGGKRRGSGVPARTISSRTTREPERLSPVAPLPVLAAPFGFAPVETPTFGPPARPERVARTRRPAELIAGAIEPWSARPMPAPFASPAPRTRRDDPWAAADRGPHPLLGGSIGRPVAPPMGAAPFLAERAEPLPAASLDFLNRDGKRSEGRLGRPASGPAGGPFAVSEVVTPSPKGSMAAPDLLRGCRPSGAFRN